MLEPDLSLYRLRFTCTVPLDREWAEPDEAAFDRFDLALLRFDEESPDLVPVATGTVYRVRPTSEEHLVLAADAEPDSQLLEEVCLYALEDDGRLRPVITEALGGELPFATTLVLDGFAFLEPQDDVPVVRGLLVRAVLAHLGEPIGVLFLPPEHAPLWGEAVGARRAGRFVVATADLQPPAPPSGGGAVVGEA